jgi:hypothetical protein
MQWSFHGKETSPRTKSATLKQNHLPTNNATAKDHDHGHEEEVEEEEGSEEVLIRTFAFRFARRPSGVSPERPDESPAALLSDATHVSATRERYSWRDMLLPSNT